MEMQNTIKINFQEIKLRLKNDPKGEGDYHLNYFSSNSDICKTPSIKEKKKEYVWEGTHLDQILLKNGSIHLLKTGFLNLKFMSNKKVNCNSRILHNF